MRFPLEPKMWTKQKKEKCKKKNNKHASTPRRILLSRFWQGHQCSAEGKKRSPLNRSESQWAVCTTIVLYMWKDTAGQIIHFSCWWGEKSSSFVLFFLAQLPSVMEGSHTSGFLSRCFVTSRVRQIPPRLDQADAMIGRGELEAKLPPHRGWTKPFSFFSPHQNQRNVPIDLTRVMNSTLVLSSSRIASLPRRRGRACEKEVQTEDKKS